ncbi:MAG: hypothetical protein DHS20C14_06980 [Phycisphaeraceae bacterium]|nr:MAG: hypothetical protein DHS20C14_06980 [Phycisphaeraceae bacterium]
MNTRTDTTRGAFTIVELMAVVGIIVLIVAIAVPAFSAMTYSTTRSLAENSLRRSITVARDVALRSERGGDGAIVFLFEPGGRMTIVAAEQVGSFDDYYTGGGEFGDGGLDELGGVGLPAVRRDVFAPSALAEAIQLPAYWNVRGFVPGGLMIDAMSNGAEIAEWYNSPLYGGQNPGANEKIQGNWVLPESGLFDPNRSVPETGEGATGRQSFMVRFDSLSGAVSTSTRSSVLIDPRPSEADRDAYNPSTPGAWRRADKASDLSTWAYRAATDPNTDANGTSYDRNDAIKRTNLIGRKSNDTVLVRPVTRLALYDERRLAAGIRAGGLNRDTRSLYRPYDRNNPEIELDETLFRAGFDRDIVRQNINSWISGDTHGGPGSMRGGTPDQLIGDGEINFDTTNNDPLDSPEAALFSISPYTGELLELNP